MASQLSDVALERAVLSGICKHNHDAYLDVADLLQPSSFTIDSNQFLYSCLKHIFKDGKNHTIDLPTIISAASELGLMSYFNKSSEQSHLKAILTSNVELDNVRDFAKKVKKFQIARDLIQVVEDTKSEIYQIRGDESLNDILGIAENKLFSFSASINERSNDSTLIGEGLEEYVQYLEDNPCEVLGISTGYPIYDKVIGGGLRTGVSLIGARAKVGKSTISTNVAHHISKNLNIPVLYLDTEMEKKEQWCRILALESKVSKDAIETGKFANNPNEKTRVNLAVQEIKNIPYEYISVAGSSFEEILSIIRRWYTKNVGQGNEGVIIYDYFKLMSSKNVSSAMMEHQALGFQLIQLNDFCIQNDIPCLSFLQLNRDGINEESSRVIGMSDRLSFFCISFSIFKPKSPEEVAEDSPAMGNRKLIPILVRHGPGLEYGNYISMEFRGDICQVKELCSKSEMNEQSGFEIQDDGERTVF